MTGRELIIYILSNRLEDEQVFKDGVFIGFLTVAEAAERLNVGIATIYMWVRQKILTSVRIGDTTYILPMQTSGLIINKGKE